MYSKKSVQGENWYLSEDIEKYRYNPRRIKNRQIAEEAHAKGKDLDFPLHVIIEPTNRCNLKCPMCNRNVMTRPICDMSLGMYKKAVDEISENNTHSISLYALGEPILHKNIREMITYAKGRGVPYVDLSTNAAIDFNIVLGTSLNEIIISVDGFKDTFEKMRYPAKYDKVLFNISHFLKAKAMRKLDWPIIRVQMIDTDETRPYKEEFIKYWLDSGADVVYIKNLEVFSHTLGDTNLSQDKINQRLKFRQPCKQLDYTLTINADGDVCACCHDVDSKSRLGNIKKNTLKECWDKLEPIRKRHKRDNYSDFDGLCKKCVDWKW